MTKTKTHKVKQVGFMDNGTGQHQSNTVYDSSFICPAITTLQGGTQQIKILVEDFYSNRDIRVYKNFAPTIRSERLGLKVVEDNERILCSDLQENGIWKSNSETI